MSGCIPPLPQYAFMVWCSVKIRGTTLTYLIDGYDVQEIPHLQCNPKIHYSVQPILNHLHSAHILIHYLFKVHFNIIRSSMTRSSKWFAHFQVSRLCISHLYQLIILDLIVVIIFVEEFM